jgi:hypothetical protein
MWGRFSDFVQDKLDTSGVEEEKNSGEIVCISVHISRVFHCVDIVACSIYSTRACADVDVCIFQGNAKATIENLQKALSEAEGRNKDINREFKKLLREKEVCFCLF